MADRGFSFSQKCYDTATILKMGGEVVNNSDGSVSVYMLNNVGVLTPVILTKTCCEALGAYTFDVDSQKCMSSGKPASCSINDVFKVVLNPKGNAGAIFYAEPDEFCQLSVDFDYLFKVNCATLSSMISGKHVGGIKTVTAAAEALAPMAEIASFDSISIQNQISEQEKICASLSYQLEQINAEIAKTPYSIECLYEQTQPVKVSTTTIAPSFTKTAFGGNSSIAPFGLYFATSTGTFCLTDDGLTFWANLLGPINYQAFINGDPNSYSCKDVQVIVDQNADIVLKNGNPLLYECSVPFGTKTSLIQQQQEILKNINTCNSILNELNVTFETVLVEVGPVKADFGSPQISSCSSPLDFFESFSVSMTVELVTTANTLETIYEQPLFGPIGSGNLYDYLVSAGTSSGFYVCGDPNSSETNFNGCTPLLFEFDGTDVDNVSACQTVMTNILDGLFTESGLSGQTDGPSIFQDSLSVSALTSNWLHFHTLITDPTILSAITNQPIKVSFKINSTCGNFCILVDEISLNKVCSKVTDTSLFITQPPSFNLERIHDNKKSWVANQTPVNRVFDMKNVFGTNPIRQTNYDVNDERLVINTKEIDLDISIAAGIETDVWCYIVDNPCLLTGTTNCNPCVDCAKQFQDDFCYEFMDGYLYEFMDDDSDNNGDESSLCCGDNSIKFDELLTQPLSDITTLEDFQYFLTSELIDAKNRQTISGYPTLKALYERYLNSIGYCGNNSSAFNYMTMDQFAGLIDNYWVDIVEQVIPATTIWGSVKIYSNTLFDQQKYKYRAYTSLLCGNPYSGKTILSPINGTTGQCTGVEVITSNIPLANQPNVRIKQVTSVCDSLCIAQMNMGSEFIGTVNVAGTPPKDCSVSDGSVINECSLSVSVTTSFPNADAIIVGANGAVTYEWSNGDTGSTTTFTSGGTYSIIVTDANCCTAAAEFYLPPPAP